MTFENLALFSRLKENMKRYTGIFIAVAAINIFIPFLGYDLGITGNPNLAIITFLLLYHLYQGNRAIKNIFLIFNSFCILFSLFKIIKLFFNNNASSDLSILILFGAVNALSISGIIALGRVKFFYNNRKSYLNEKIYLMTAELKDMEKTQNSK